MASNAPSTEELKSTSLKPVKTKTGGEPNKDEINHFGKLSVCYSFLFDFGISLQ